MNNFVPINLATWIKMSKFFEKRQFTKTDTGEIKNLSINLSIKEINSLIKTFPSRPKKNPLGQDVLTGKLYQVFKGKKAQFLYKVLQKIQEGTLPNSFYEVSIILIPKSEVDSSKK